MFLFAAIESRNGRLMAKQVVWFTFMNMFQWHISYHQYLSLKMRPIYILLTAFQLGYLYIPDPNVNSRTVIAIFSGLWSVSSSNCPSFLKWSCQMKWAPLHPSLLGSRNDYTRDIQRAQMSNGIHSPRHSAFLVGHRTFCCLCFRLWW